MSFDRASADAPPGGYPRSEQWDTVLDHIELLDRRDRGSSYWTGGALASSSGAETAFAAWTGDNSFTFYDGRICRLDVQVVVYNAAVAFSTIERIQINIRKAVNSTVAQLLGSALLETQGTGSSGATVKTFTAFIKNSTGADLTGVHLGLTVQRTTGAASNTMYGDASFPCFIIATDVGAVADHTTLAALATSIT